MKRYEKGHILKSYGNLKFQYPTTDGTCQERILTNAEKQGEG